MASLIRQKGCQFWIACYRDQFKRQHRKSTHHTDRKKAQKMADDLERMAQGKINELEALQVYQQVLSEAYHIDRPHSSVEKYLESWLKSKEQEVSKQTLSNYRHALLRFVDFLGDRAGMNMMAVTRDLLIDFRKSMVGKLSIATINASIHVVKSVFIAAEAENYVLKDPSKAVELVRNDAAAVRRPFTLSELRRLLLAANDEWRTLILLGINTGQRLGDLCRLTWRDINLERQEIYFVTSKTGRQLVIPLSESMRDHLMELPSSDYPDAPVVPRSYQSYQRHRSASLSSQFAALMTIAGLREPRVKRYGQPRKSTNATYPLSFHCLRHTAVTILAEAGVPDAVIQELIGHRSIAMSRHYTSVGIESLRKAVRSLPKL